MTNYKIPTLKLPFIPLIFLFFLLCTLFIYFFFRASGWSGWPGLSVLVLLWVMFASLIYTFIKTYKEGLIINNEGFNLSYKGQKVEFNWEEIEKIGFQAIIAKRMGIYEIIPYLTIELKDNSKIMTLKSSREFGFLQKKIDLSSYMDQKDVLDLYISMKFASDNDSSMADFLSNRPNFIKKMIPIIKTSNEEEYKMILKDNFTS
ncbi:MAG: hypothetical protein AAB910_01730 [Patescibacteria group bacterium]